MAKFKPQYRRLLFIDRKLREGGYPNCSGLAAEWEVSAKTIHRDIEYMKYELGAPIGYDGPRHGFFYSEPRFSLPAIQISESDLFAVCIAHQALEPFRNTPLHARLASVFSKIEASLPSPTTIQPSWIGDRILLFPQPVTRVDTGTWDTIARAIQANRRLFLSHASPGQKDATGREVDPYYLVSYRGEWYLSGFCHTRQAIRTFAVSRIRGIAMREETFRMPEGMDRDTLFGDPFGIIWNAKRHRVRIRFSAALAPYIRERDWHPLQKLRERRDGGCELEFTTNHLNEVKDWVLSWGEGATALAPRELVDRITAGLRASLHAYFDSTTLE